MSADAAPVSRGMSPDPAVPAVIGSLAERLLTLPGVVAVALAGSRATGMAGPGSDVDLHVYCGREVPLAPRRALAAEFADPAAGVEVGNDAFGPGDEWTEASTGLGVDLMYWTTGWISDQLDRVLVRHEAGLGYSTAWWHNVRSARTLAERDGWHTALLRRADRPYPEALRRAVVARNHPLLRPARSSFLAQVSGALARRDAPAVLDRTASLLASYLDVLFALNRVPHPGEKRSAQWVARTCPLAPAAFAERLDAVAAAASPDAGGSLPGLLHGLVDDLDALLLPEGLLTPAYR